MLTEKGEALGSVSMASIRSVFYPHVVLNSLYVDQKSHLGSSLLLESHNQ